MDHPLFSPKRLLVNAGALLSGTMAARLLSAITLVLTARILGPDGFGPYASALSLARITAFLFNLGLDPWLMRMGGQHPHLLRHYSSSALVLKVGLGIVWLGGIQLGARWLDQATYPPVVVALCAVAIWFEEISLLMASSFKTALRNQITFVILVIGPALLLLGSAGLLLQEVADLTPYLMVRGGASFIAMLLGVGVWLREIGWEWHSPTIQFAWRDSRPFAASVALGNFGNQADVTIVAGWLG